MTKTLLLNSLDKVKYFSSACERQDYEIDVIQGRYIVDGKSIMGLLSLSLNRPIEIRIYDKTADTKNLFRELADAGIEVRD